MALHYTFPTPVTVGSYPNQIQVAAVRLAAVSFNFEHSNSGAPTPVCAVSIVLEDVATGHKFINPKFCDGASLTLLRALMAATNPATGHTFEADIIAKALTATDPASGKPAIPASGTVSTAPSGGA